MIIMGFFVVQWATMLVGFVVHAAVDRSPRRHTSGRLVELALLWLLVAGGFWAAVGGIFHIGPTSAQIAAGIGYAPSMFQWEVGWADIALGVLGMGCAWRRNRGGWMTAAVVALLVSYWGDGIGHIMQLVAHGNTAPENVWSLPSDFLQPLLALVLLIAYRRHQPSAADSGGAGEPVTKRAPSSPIEQPPAR
jgi:hypothetical protein